MVPAATQLGHGPHLGLVQVLASHINQPLLRQLLVAHTEPGVKLPL